MCTVEEDTHQLHNAAVLVLSPSDHHLGCTTRPMARNGILHKWYPRGSPETWDHVVLSPDQDYRDHNLELTNHANEGGNVSLLSRV